MLTINIKGIFMKTFKMLSLLIATTFFFISCSDDSPTNPNGSKNFFPKNIGNYWIFNEYSLDIENQKENADSPFLDSAAITGTVTAFGKDLLKYDVFTFTDDAYEKKYDMQLAYEDEGLFIRSNYFNSFFQFEELGMELPFQLPDTVLKVVDIKNPYKREVYSRKFDEVSIPGTPVGDLKVNGNMTIFSTKTGEETISINGNDVQAIKYTIPISFDGTIGITTPFPYKEKFVFALNYNVYLAENIGIVKTHLESEVINIPLIDYDYNYLGFLTELIRYNIVK